MIYETRKQCLLCGKGAFTTVLNLGDLHLNAFPLPGEADPPKAPLHVVRCRECGLLQLNEIVDSDLLYRQYWYRSGTNQTMRDALKDVVTDLPVKLEPFDTVIDIGSNDNTLLKAYQENHLHKVGFEPSNIGLESSKESPLSITVVHDYFGYRPWLDSKAKVVTSIAMFYGVRDPYPFIEDVKKVLHPDGVWVLQLAYLPAILERNAFDGICHEHVAYYSLATLERLVESHGLHVFDAKLIDLNEGSIRLYISASPRPVTDRLRQLRIDEHLAFLDTEHPYRQFAERVAGIKERVLRFLDHAASQGLVVHGYGASTKGNTLLQYFGVTPGSPGNGGLLEAIWERQEQKWGRETVGTRIPIISEADGRQKRPDALLVLPWHFADEFLKREKEYLNAGGQIVLPLPDFRLVRVEEAQ